MNAKLQRIYDETPEELPEPVSRLEPFRDLILRWRRDGRSYPAICSLLKIQCGVNISKQGLRVYVLRRTRKRKAPLCEGQAEVQLVPAQSPSSIKQPLPKRSAAEKAALRMAAKASNHKPTVVHKERKELFVFDEDKPLTNKPEEKKAPWQQQR